MVKNAFSNLQTISGKNCFFNYFIKTRYSDTDGIPIVGPILY